MALSDMYQSYNIKTSPKVIVNSILEDDIKYNSLNELFAYIESKCEGFTKEEVYEIKIVVVLKELLNEKLVYNDIIFIITNLRNYIDRKLYDMDISYTVTNWYYYGNDFFEHDDICKLDTILGTNNLSYLAYENDMIFSDSFEFVSLEHYLGELGLEDEIYLEDILRHHNSIGYIHGDGIEFLSHDVAEKFVFRILDSFEYCCDYYLGETASILVNLDHSVYEDFWSNEIKIKYKDELLYVINCLVDVYNDNNIDFLVKYSALLEVCDYKFSEDLDFKSILLLHLYKKCPSKKEVIMKNLDASVKDYFISKVPSNDTSLYN